MKEDVDLLRKEMKEMKENLASIEAYHDKNYTRDKLEVLVESQQGIIEELRSMLQLQVFDFHDVKDS